MKYYDDGLQLSPVSKSDCELIDKDIEHLLLSMRSLREILEHSQYTKEDLICLKNIGISY